MTIRLRPHHLLCLTTYMGKGYTPAFTANYDRIVARVVAGEPVELVEGPDDICRPLLAEAEPHCHNASVVERDRLAWDSVQPLLDHDRIGPLTLNAAAIAKLRTVFRTGAIRAACTGCEWSELCDAVAESGFAATRFPAGR
ncbi:DUF1284 domain-containing protein [Devosia elaeis]|uniref:2Fe-2S ferredoxin n=1 Tax=Devosia elaeis TaxID=1770058 RepID=A0A178HPF4_9HYPH|nr:DUF1284 domain-containing protein [Devosia elaeis]OAM73928.1 2Fe-2S ferredoxin [Devosia elaeis]